MWDAFFESVADEENVDALADLETAVDEGTVSESMLERYRDAIAGELGLASGDVAFLVVPRAERFDEQIAILDRLAPLIETGEELLIDVTHGFRHLPMLGLVAARYLEKVRGARVGDIIYGALAMKDASGARAVPGRDRRRFGIRATRAVARRFSPARRPRRSAVGLPPRPATSGSVARTRRRIGRRCDAGCRRQVRKCLLRRVWRRARAKHGCRRRSDRAGRGWLSRVPRASAASISIVACSTR